jgi:hypothetical protein
MLVELAIEFVSTIFIHVAINNQNQFGIGKATLQLIQNNSNMLLFRGQALHGQRIEDHWGI